MLGRCDPHLQHGGSCNKLFVEWPIRIAKWTRPTFQSKMELYHTADYLARYENEAQTPRYARMHFPESLGEMVSVLFYLREQALPLY